jgi:hypothetical protein
MKKEYIIGAVALTAVVGGYFWWKSRNSSDTTEEDTPISGLPPAHPLEGKNIALKGADGNYTGGVIYRVKNGKKMAYGNNQFETGYGINWDKYCVANTDCMQKLVLVSQDVIDALPDAPKPTTTTAFTGNLMQNRQVL